MGGAALFLLFLALGVLSLWRPLYRFGRQTRLYLGLSLGFVQMMWLPALFAFFINFTARAQLCALGASVLLASLSFFLTPKRESDFRKAPPEPPLALTLSLVLPFLALSAYLQYTHILRDVGGALHVGQSTYGDLCLHLGIATGLVDAPFPPEYTILPGTLLGYPFLFDALSASMLCWGAPLSLAFILPGTLAMGLVFWGFVLYAWSLTKNARAVALAFLLVFVNGGLGFLYVFDGWPQDTSRLADVFTGYYRAPANMPEYNLRWVNVICDMMVPQRTLLGGWVTLLPALYLLQEALRAPRRSLFLGLGVWAGLMPMVHTHSFVALALLSFGAMVSRLIRDREHTRETLACFALYAGVAGALALPQFLTWTLPQTVGGGALALRFNWVNSNGSSLIDGYLWFWLKNVGPVFLLIPLACVNAGSRGRALSLGALTVFVVAETIQFQPNEYDNNKLFYVAFLAVMPLVGALLSRLWDRLRGIRGRGVLAAAFLTVCLLSGGLSLAREAISDYELFGADEARAADYIRQNAEEDAVFLTSDQHTNVPATLAGRKIVCGTGSYLYYHGLDYDDRQFAAQEMLQRPVETAALYQKYGVNYVYLSDHERYGADADEEALRARFPLWYEDGRVTILKVG